uniref:Uncharacterized protein n=1 Tax=Rhizophora mucronata TaxID=61149 RepID=A0A2P2QFB9_RHIMU
MHRPSVSLSQYIFSTMSGRLRCANVFNKILLFFSLEMCLVYIFYFLL